MGKFNKFDESNFREEASAWNRTLHAATFTFSPYGFAAVFMSLVELPLQAIVVGDKRAMLSTYNRRGIWAWVLSFIYRVYREPLPIVYAGGSYQHLPSWQKSFTLPSHLRNVWNRFDMVWACVPLYVCMYACECVCVCVCVTANNTDSTSREMIGPQNVDYLNCTKTVLFSLDTHTHTHTHGAL